MQKGYHIVFLSATAKLLRYGRTFYSASGTVISPIPSGYPFHQMQKRSQTLRNRRADGRIRTDTGIPHPGLNRMRFPITPHLPTGRGRIRTCVSRPFSLTSYLADRWHKPLAHTTILFCCQTETQGFEPWNRISGLQFSRLPQSTTLPNLPHAVSGSRTHMRLRLLLGQVCIPVPP